MLRPMSALPPTPPQWGPVPGGTAGPAGAPEWAAAPMAVPASERTRVAWQRRHESDYLFDFWTAFGWTLLSCGVYGFYVFYQLMRRSRDHNRRRLELLDAATTFAWEQARARGLDEALRPNFERIAANMRVLGRLTTEFRDPALWVVLMIVSGVAEIVGWIFIDGDLVDHDHAEGAIEADLAVIYTRLGRPIAAPDPARLKGRHNYVGRIFAFLGSFGIYGLWWLRDLMDEGNRHFEHNWRFEDELAQATQSLMGG